MRDAHARVRLPPRARARACASQRVYREYHRDCELRWRGPGLFIEEFRDRHTAPRAPNATQRFAFFRRKVVKYLICIPIYVCTVGKVDIDNVAAGTLIARVSFHFTPSLLFTSLLLALSI